MHSAFGGSSAAASRPVPGHVSLPRGDIGIEDPDQVPVSSGQGFSVEDGSAASPPHRQTRSQHGIFKPKSYTDGTIKYAALASTGEPRTLSEALNDSNWKQAMESEIGALHENKTCHLVSAHGRENVIDSK
jgi:hypothetical protein